MRGSAIRCGSLVAALGLAGLAVTTIPVSAAARTPAHASARHALSTLGLTAHISIPRGADVPSTDEGAGYYSYPGGSALGVSGASATFTMPGISCASSSDYEWLLPGIWVFNTAGQLTEQVDVNFNCDEGTLLEEAIVEVQGQEGAMAVSPGDTVVASLSESATATAGNVHDLTSGGNLQEVGAATSSDDTVFIGDEGPDLFGVTAVPTFSKVTFSNAMVDGEYLNLWTPARYNLKTGSDTQIDAGTIGRPGDTFKTTFKHND